MRLDPNLYRNLKRYHIVRFSHWEPADVDRRIKAVMVELRKRTPEERQMYCDDIQVFFDENGFDEGFFTRQPKHPQSPEERAIVSKLVEDHARQVQKAAEVAAFKKKHPEMEEAIRRQVEREMMAHVGHPQ